MFKNKLKQKTKSANEYVKTFIKWIILATLTGGVGGIAGTFFNKCIVYVTRIRNKNEWIILLLPLGGLLIVFLYRVCKMEKNTGTNNVIKSVRSEEKVPFVLAPLIFVGTVITHLFGGSVGREGAALQLGGSIGEMTGRLLRLNENDMHVVRMCGMSTVFSALFGTPLTATIFALEVISVGIIHYSAFIPCLLSAVLSYKISLLFGVMPETYILPFTPFLSMATFAKTIVIGIVCAVVSIFFCVGIFGTNKLFTKWFKNPYIRVFVGGLIIVVLTFSLGTTDYNGAGMNIIDAAVLQGKAVPYAFLLKILFTAVTIGSGYKGGEIVPTLFIGATLGCTVGHLIGFYPPFAAALGMIGMFCGVVNCPIASIMLSVELFGSKGMVLFATVAAVSYMMSGYYGLYSGQKIIYSKLRTELIDIYTKREY